MVHKFSDRADEQRKEAEVGVPVRHDMLCNWLPGRQAVGHVDHVGRASIQSKPFQAAQDCAQAAVERGQEDFLAHLLLLARLFARHPRDLHQSPAVAPNGRGRY